MSNSTLSTLIVSAGARGIGCRICELDEGDDDIWLVSLSVKRPAMNAGGGDITSPACICC